MYMYVCIYIYNRYLYIITEQEMGLRPERLTKTTAALLYQSLSLILFWGGGGGWCKAVDRQGRLKSESESESERERETDRERERERHLEEGFRIKIHQRI
jgi:hypothetical protein